MHYVSDMLLITTSRGVRINGGRKMQERRTFDVGHDGDGQVIRHGKRTDDLPRARKRLEVEQSANQCSVSGFLYVLQRQRNTDNEKTRTQNRIFRSMADGGKDSGELVPDPVDGFLSLTALLRLSERMAEITT